MNRTRGPNGGLLFDYSAQPTSNSPAPDSNLDTLNVSSGDDARRKRNGASTSSYSSSLDQSLEGFKDEPTFTKVVDRRWYERNKHIFPASVWEVFDPEKDYTKAIKRDTGGNAFFFS